MRKPFERLTLALVVATASVLLWSSSGLAQTEPTPEPDIRAQLLAACPICEVDPGDYTGALSVTEVESLLLALNDEYHAYAIYGQVIEAFGPRRPFTNIQRAEAKHIQAVEHLMSAYGIPIPENPWTQSLLHVDSIPAACSAAVEAERVNRDLYDVLIASTDRTDLITIFRKLQWASEERHLPAFERCSMD